jgi:hypothetical protein
MTAKQRLSAAMDEILAKLPDDTPRPAPLVEPAFLRPNPAADFTSVSRRTLANWARHGLLPVHRIGPRVTLYAVADLRACIAKFRIGKVSA